MTAPRPSLPLASADDSGLWLRCFTPVAEPRARVVALPHAGGAASSFLGASRLLAEHGVELHAVQYPGRQDRRHEPFAESIHALALAVAPAVRRLQADTGGPVSLFGHSFGAVTAFETARLLEDDGAAPQVLVVSGRRAPGADHSHDLRHLASDDDLVCEIQRLEGTQEGLLDDPEIRALALPVLRHDFTAAAAYRLLDERSLGCPVVVFGGDRDPGVPVDDLAAWSAHTVADVDVRVFPGGHFYLDQVATDVAAALAAVVTDPATHAR